MFFFLKKKWTWSAWGVYAGDCLGEGESACSLLSGLQQGLPCSFIGSCIFEQQFRRNGDILTSIFYPQLLNLLKCWGMPLEDAMLKGADVRIITNEEGLNILPS